MITITRINLKRCKFTFSTKKEKKYIDSVLKHWVEGAFYSEKYKKGIWDGFYSYYNSKQEFDYGLLFELVYILDRNNVDYEYYEDYIPDFNQDNISMKVPNGMTHRKYQEEAVRKFFENNIGIIIVPTRGGKTFISSQIMRNVIENDSNNVCLFIVDSIDLFTQTVNEISNFLGINKDTIGKINQDNFSISNINIAMIQTIDSVYNSKNKEKLKILRKLERQTTFLAVDEIQDNSSDNRIKIYSKYKNLKFVLGISATPFKQMDTKSAFRVKGFFGDVCYEVKKQRLQKEGFLSLDKAILIANKSEAVGLAENYNEFLDLYIHNNHKRNSILIKVMEICKRNKWKTLYLFSSKKHGNIISKITGEVFIDGDSKQKDRDLHKSEFLKMKGGILMASNIFKKGVTLPEVEVCVIADGGLEGSDVIQKFGRMLGTTKNKKRAIVIDVLDLGNKYFSEHSLNRLEVYEEEIGNKRIEIHEEGDWLDIEDSLKEWLYVNK